MYYKLDFMRFTEQGEQDFQEVIREEAGSRVYHVYNYQIMKYPSRALLFHYRVDLNSYSEAAFDYWVSNWGYDSYRDFVDYMDNHTELYNHELRLASCAVLYDTLLKEDIDTEGTIDDCIGRLTDLLGGRSPYDDSDQIMMEEERRKKALRDQMEAEAKQAQQK